MEQTQEKVTRKVLREMRIGQTRIFWLKEARKINSVRVTCNQLMYEEDLKFTVKADYPGKSVMVQRVR